MLATPGGVSWRDAGARGSGFAKIPHYEFDADPPRVHPGGYTQHVITTFTFTLNCHLGKTHSHRSRGVHSSVQFSYFVNNRQPNGSLSNVLSKLAVGVRLN